MKDINILYIEDDKENREGLISVLSGNSIDDYSLQIDAIENFEDGIEKVISKDYHIIVLDIYKGKPEENGEQAGLNVLQEIQNKCFIPVIFYSGNTSNVTEYKSQVVGVVTKGDEGIEGLKLEIQRLAKNNLPFIKENIHKYLENEFKDYFWNIIHEERNKFTFEKNDFSLGYLMLRKFGNSLSKAKISEIIGDSDLTKNKVHPMEFYIYPTDAKSEYESGEILQKDDAVFVILTPSCDFIERFDKNGSSTGRKVGKVLLTKTELLKNTSEFNDFKKSKKEDDKNKLKKIVTSGKSDRYFFLPETPFIENRIIDFQNKVMVEYSDLKDYIRLAKLDNPFAEGMIASFIRYYNRIGYPDIDSDYIISRI